MLTFPTTGFVGAAQEFGKTFFNLLARLAVTLTAQLAGFRSDGS